MLSVRHRERIGDLLVELLTVFIGVTAAFALDGWRSDRTEAAYRRQMIGSLGSLIDSIADHNSAIERDITRQIAEFDAARRRGERPVPPIYREPGAERPPTGAWTGIVTTGAARALPPDLYIRVSNFFNVVDGWGDKYARYNAVTEARVLPNVDDPATFYTPSGELRGEFKTYVYQLRDIALLCRHTTELARQLRHDVRAASGP